MGVRVDDHRYHRLACEAHARGAGRHANVGGSANLGDLRAVHNQRCVLDHASVAYDQPRAFVRCDGLRGCRGRKSRKKTKDNDYRDYANIHSTHGNLLMKYAL
jgi:hypothetical protein